MAIGCFREPTILGIDGPFLANKKTDRVSTRRPLLGNLTNGYSCYGRDALSSYISSKDFCLSILCACW